MNVESIVQTVLITTLLGLIPKILDALLRFSKGFSWNDLRALRSKEVVVKIEYERQSDGKHSIMLTGDAATGLLVQEIQEYITHRVHDTDGGCNLWQAYSSFSMMPLGSVVIDGVSLHCQQHVTSNDKNTISRKSIIARAASRQHIADFIEAAQSYRRSTYIQTPPQYLSQNMKKDERFWMLSDLHISTTWDDLFYPERDSLRKHIESLEESAKITLLLHGPPGTGKTSTIRAIAAATKRNVVNIDLGLVRNNQDLHEVVFATRRLPTANSNVSNYVNLTSKFIFVLEEIDLQLEALEKRSSALQLSTSKSDREGDAFDNYYKSYTKVKENQLTLGGLLTLLDGIQQLQDSILIMTTNHPEKLDPRLLRAGRVTHNIRLGHLESRFARAMIERVHGKSPEEVRDHYWIPAELEQLLAQHTEYEDFLVQFSMHQKQ